MADDVKRESRPPVGRGQARTRLARRAVIDAARSLFVERRYAATTIDASARRADVPPATVYRLFSSKLGILKALLDTSIAGDDEPVAVPDRPDVAARFVEPDAHAAVGGVRRCHHRDQRAHERRVPRPRRRGRHRHRCRRAPRRRSTSSATRANDGSPARSPRPARSRRDCASATLRTSSTR